MIEIIGLSKSYGSVQALKDINLKIEASELFGLIGPDGAGKTTLFRLVASLLLPDSGQISVFGFDSVKEYKNVRQILGYMPGRFSLYMDLSVEENLDFYATVFGTTISESYHLIKDVYSQIEPFKKRPAGKLSGGMKQKLALCCALVHQPKLLILDEPTTGVDAVSRKEFWELLTGLKEKGITILVSTPYMDEASLCDRVALIQSGQILKTNSPEAIVKQYGFPLFAFRTPQAHKYIPVMSDMNEIRLVYAYGQELHIVAGAEHFSLEKLKTLLASRGIENAEVFSIQPQIEDCFISLMQS